MMHLRAKVFIALSLLCWPLFAQAGDSTYLCKVLQAVELSDDGHIVKEKGFWSNMVGAAGGSFTVNRETGEMIGAPFGTDGWLGGVKVLDRGGNGNAYKALVLSGKPNISTMYIYITEYVESPNKPFWGNGDGRVIFSGTCL